MNSRKVKGEILGMFVCVDEGFHLSNFWQNGLMKQIGIWAHDVHNFLKIVNKDWVSQCIKNDQREMRYHKENHFHSKENNCLGFIKSLWGGSSNFLRFLTVDYICWHHWASRTTNCWAENNVQALHWLSLINTQNFKSRWREWKKSFNVEVNERTRLAPYAHLLLKCLFQIPVL